MKISLLRTRENFGAIFFNSLRHFTSKYFGKPINIAPAGKGDVSFRKNNHLNIIYPVKLQSTELHKLSAEFNYTNNIAKRVLQTTYCTLAITPPFSRFLSPKFFDLLDPPPEMVAWVFLPGNHTIRIIDTENDISIVYPKEGFEQHFFLNDARVRKMNPDLPAPQVLIFDEAGGWYVEERICGLPLNRIPDQEIVATALRAAIQGITDLREKTMQSVEAQDYAQDLIVQLRETIVGDLEIDKSVAQFIVDIQAILERNENFKLTLCRTHGDFQPANILSSSSKTWLIDWEYSEIRSAVYDYLVFTTGSRFTDGFGSRIVAARDRAEAEGGINAWGYEQKANATILISIFLLEDLYLRLRGVAAEAIFEKAHAILPWLQEARSILESD